MIRLKDLERKALLPFLSVTLALLEDDFGMRYRGSKVLGGTYTKQNQPLEAAGCEVRASGHSPAAGPSLMGTGLGAEVGRGSVNAKTSRPQLAHCSHGLRPAALHPPAAQHRHGEWILGSPSIYCPSTVKKPVLASTMGYD